MYRAVEWFFALRAQPLREAQPLRYAPTHYLGRPGDKGQVLQTGGLVEGIEEFGHLVYSV